jgi:hypothetical protein
MLGNVRGRLSYLELIHLEKSKSSIDTVTAMLNIAFVSLAKEGRQASNDGASTQTRG